MHIIYPPPIMAPSVSDRTRVRATVAMHNHNPYCAVSDRTRVRDDQT